MAMIILESMLFILMGANLREALEEILQGL